MTTVNDVNGVPISVGGWVKVIGTSLSLLTCREATAMAIMGGTYEVETVDLSDNTVRVMGVAQISGSYSDTCWLSAQDVEVCISQQQGENMDSNQTQATAEPAVLDMNGDAINPGDSVIVVRYVGSLLWDEGDFADLRQKTLGVVSIDAMDGTLLIEMLDDVIMAERGTTVFWVPAAAVQKVETAQAKVAPNPELPPLVAVRREVPDLVPVSREVPELTQIPREVPPLVLVTRQEASGGPSEVEGLVPYTEVAAEAPRPFAEVWAMGGEDRAALVGRLVTMVREEDSWGYWTRSLATYVGRSGVVRDVGEERGLASSLRITGWGGWNFPASCFEFADAGSTATTPPSETISAEAAEPAQFRVGERVRIVRAVYGRNQDPIPEGALRDASYGPSWNGYQGMDSTLGTIGTVEVANRHDGSVTVRVNAGRTWNYSPRSLEPVSRGGIPVVPTLTPVQRHSPPATPTTHKYMTIGGVCETDVVLLLGVRDVSRADYLFYKTSPFELRKEVMAPLCRAAGKDLEGILGKDLHEGAGTSLSRSHVVSSSILRVTELDRQPEDDEDEDDLSRSTSDLFWMAEYKVEVDAEGNLNLDMSNLADNFFTL